MEYREIVEPEPEIEIEAEVFIVPVPPRKRLRLVPGALAVAVCLSGFALLHFGMAGWFGIHAALAADGSAVLYLLGSRRAWK